MIWWQAMLAVWAVNAVLMAGLWIVATKRRNAGVVDVAWSFATGLSGAALAILVGGTSSRAILVAVIAAAWGVRLGSHLARRVASEAEDGRYAHLRTRLGSRFDAAMFVFFQLQASWAVIFSAPMMVAAMRGGSLDLFDAIGAFIWCAALAGETIADRQLHQWKRDRPEGEVVCRRGLWGWSRHPNYFFEWTHWFAYVAIGITGPWGWLTLAGPAVMLVFLLRITGIRVAERRSVERRGEPYRQYQREVSVFVPWPPRRSTRSSSAEPVS